MAAARPAQINIRSDVVRRRVREVQARTGMSATRFIEEAVLSYDPPQEVLPEGLHREGWLLVGHTFDGRPVTLEETNAWIDADRCGERE